MELNTRLHSIRRYINSICMTVVPGVVSSVGRSDSCFISFLDLPVVTISLSLTVSTSSAGGGCTRVTLTLQPLRREASICALDVGVLQRAPPNQPRAEGQPLPLLCLQSSVRTKWK